MELLARNPHIALFAIGLALVIAALVYMIAARRDVGSPALAAALSGGFASYTAVTIFSEGLIPVWDNHTSNLWGIQVWWDLLFAVGIATFLILPRARAQGMNVIPWVLFIAATASIGLLAMIARLFWLERSAAAKP